MIEIPIQKQIIDYLKVTGFIVFRMNAGKGRYNQYLAPNGTPDLLAVKKHRKKPLQVWLEIKAGKNKPTPEQLAMHKKLRAAGQIVITVRSLDDVREWVEPIRPPIGELQFEEEQR